MNGGTNRLWGTSRPVIRLLPPSGGRNHERRWDNLCKHTLPQYFYFGPRTRILASHAGPPYAFGASRGVWSTPLCVYGRAHAYLERRRGRAARSSTAKAFEEALLITILVRRKPGQTGPRLGQH
ncbi:hypothetical protein EVAR_15984_1 [Eumeta japonica]|uniref:Uncharacterized protein n=1 Tax=Eumeta variegata TaxID=151549 RepID=A0A4C1UL85_EUMVA|nr:hypothetical protein EVAR_15984_1 [Eumeta japonica]